MTAEPGEQKEQTRESTPESSSSGSNMNEELMEITTPISTVAFFLFYVKHCSSSFGMVVMQNTVHLFTIIRVFFFEVKLFFCFYYDIKDTLSCISNYITDNNNNNKKSTGVFWSRSERHHKRDAITYRTKLGGREGGRGLIVS